MPARSLAIVIATLLGTGALAPQSVAATVARWVQFAPGGTVMLRAIDDRPGAACPAASVDSVAVPLAPRVADHPSDAFPVTQCEASVPVGGVSASIDGVRLKLPVAEPRRIILIGDTGCRVLPGAVQACNDPGPHGFPLARLAQMVAAMDPDLIVHVGDYYYREAPCPAGNEGCAGTPYGDNWGAWNADWVRAGAGDPGCGAAGAVAWQP